MVDTVERQFTTIYYTILNENIKNQPLDPHFLLNFLALKMVFQALITSTICASKMCI